MQIDPTMKVQLIVNVVSDFAKLGMIVPIDYEFERCNSTSYVGKCFTYKKKIVVSDKVRNDEDYKNVVAHECIHALGIHGHGREFKKVMNKINKLGYDVRTNANHMDIEQVERQYKYIIKCEYCDWERKYRIHHNDLHMYMCPECKTRNLVEIKIGE